MLAALREVHSHETTHGMVAGQLGLAATTLEAAQRDLLARGERAAAAMLPIFAEGALDAGDVSRVQRAAARDRRGAAAAVAGEQCRLARDLAATAEGCALLARMPFFHDGIFSGARGEGSASTPEAVRSRIAAAETNLAVRLHKEAARLLERPKRLGMMTRPTRSLQATQLFDSHPHIVRDLQREGAAYVRGAIAPEDAKAIRDHYEAQLARKTAFGPPNTEPCNRGSLSRHAPVDGDDPEAAESTAAILRRTFAFLVGVAKELEDRCALELGVPSEAASDAATMVLREMVAGVPREEGRTIRDRRRSSRRPEVNVAFYPPGTRYRRHRDWYPTEHTNDREVTIMTYLNESWTADDGGALVIEREDGTERAIVPDARVLVVFLSRTRDHRVEPSRRTRAALTLWCDRRRDGG